MSTSIARVRESRNQVWDVGQQAWVAMQQPTLEADSVTVAGTITVEDGGGSLTVDGSVTTAQTPLQLTIASGSVSSQGNNTLITPTAGKKIRLYYCAYNPGAAVEAAFRFGAAGTLFLRANLVAAGAVVAKDFGDFRYVQGAADEVLILNLSGAVATIWNAFYTEVT